MKLFYPILAGANLPDRLIASLGALIGISLAALICGFIAHGDFSSALLVAPMGASAVLLFAVPASPLAQPWPIIGGNTLSAIIGLIVGHLVPHPALAVGIAVGLSIVTMSLTRSLHPPGGAMALGSALGGKAVADWGLLFPLFPVALNALLLVAVGIAFHRLGKRNYPHKAVQPAPTPHLTADPPPAARLGFTPEDIDAVLSSMHESFDIDRDDLETLLGRIEQRALQRAHPALTCGDVMSRDVVSADLSMPVSQVLALMAAHRLHRIPITAQGAFVGMADLQDLKPDTPLEAHLSKPATGEVDEPAFQHLPALLEGGQQVMILGAGDNILGILTQTDMLAALSRLVPIAAKASALRPPVAA